MAAQISSADPREISPEKSTTIEASLAALRRRFPRAILDRYLDTIPSLGDRVFLAPGAALVGDVECGEDVSFWYGAVARGDIAPIRIGARTNIQDGTVLHVGDHTPCIIGADVVIGHRVMAHGCQVEDGCLIGMQATLLDDCVIGRGSIIGAGTLVTQRTIIPPFSLVLGMPGKIVRSLPVSTFEDNRALAAKYQRLKENYRLALVSDGRLNQP
jgi:carbonic anhydrase/acetyltransferase-like protein (isoleucine patch superfamily)